MAHKSKKDSLEQPLIIYDPLLNIDKCRINGKLHHLKDQEENEKADWLAGLPGK